MTIKRGRKSAADLTVVSATGARIQRPEHLNESESEEWDAIVTSLPADWFRPADVSLLACYCSASAIYKQAKAMLVEEGLTIGEGGSRKAHPASQIMQAQAGSLAQMAVKLRLCPSARYTEKTAATKAISGGGARPWEETGTE